MRSNPFDFARLIDPIEPAAFLTGYWERQPLLVQRGSPDHYAQLFSSARMEQLLHCTPMAAHDLRVVLQQAELAPGLYTQSDGRLNMNQLYKAYGEGHTLVINRLQRFDTQLSQLASTLENLLSFRVEFNVYLTPAGTQGLHPHYDTHDVFVLQIEGHKDWHLYGCAQPSPLLNTFQPVIPVTALPPLERTVRLEAGDLLYLPRGYVHDAVATTSHSMHLTLGIYPVQWVDLLQSALTQRALDDVRYRQAAPVGFLHRKDRREQVESRLRELLADFASHAPLERVVEAQDEQGIRQARPQADGHFSSLHEAGRLTLESRLKRRSHLRCRVLVDGQHVRVQFPGNVFRASVEYEAALFHAVQSVEPFAVRDLPGEIDDGRRLVLAQRLIRAGLLSVVAPVAAQAQSEPAGRGEER